MSLLVWLPLNNSIINQGISNTEFTSTNLTYALGKVAEYAALFNGTNTLIKNKSNINISKYMTFACWVKFNEGFSEGFIIEGRTDDGTGTGKGYQPMYGGPNYGFQFFSSNATTVDTHSTWTKEVCNFGTNTWYHLVVVVTPTSAELFINGNSKGLVRGNFGADFGLMPIQLGARYTLNSNTRLKGLVNDLRIYDHALSIKEIKELARGFCLHYKFNLGDLYKSVDYIESTGTQYIAPNIDLQTGFKIKTKICPKSASINMGLFGSYDNNAKRNYVVMVGEEEPANQYKFLVGYGSGSSAYTYFGSWQINTIYDIEISNIYGNRYAIINGTSFTLNEDATQTYNSNKPGLLALNTNNGYAHKFIGRLYQTKIYNANGTLVLDLIPCIRRTDNKPGLLDIINYTFYTNQGSGDFLTPQTTILGSDYTPVDYVESDGTQYIDSSYTPNENTIIEGTFMHTEHAIDTPLFGARNGAPNYNNSYTFWAHPSDYTTSPYNTVIFNDVSTEFTGCGKPSFTKETFYYSKDRLNCNEYTKSISTSSGNPSWSLILLGLRNGNDIDTRKFIGRIYTFKISEGTTVMHDYRPCIRNSDNRVGFFDVITKNFIVESGGNKFTTHNIINPYIEDACGLGNNGSLVNLANGNTANSTIVGDSASVLNGTSSYIKSICPKFLGDHFTVNLWAYKANWQEDTSSKSHEKLISCTQGGGWSLGISYNVTSSTGSLWFGVYDYKSAESTYTNASITNNAANLPAGWHMLTGTFDGSTVKLYIDGMLKKATNLTNPDTFKYHDTVCTLIGAEPDAQSLPDASSSNFFTGNIADVQFYATLLTAAEVQELYNTKISTDSNGNLYCNTIKEAPELKFLKTSGVWAKLFLESSDWVPICVHYLPSGYFNKNSTDYDTLHVQSGDIWSNFGLINTITRPESNYYEFLVIHQLSVDGNWEYYRWKQKANPLTAVFADVQRSKVNETGDVVHLGTNVSGYINSGGMYSTIDTTVYQDSRKNIKMCFANNAEKNWFGCAANSAATEHNADVPSYNNKWVKGWQLVFMRAASESQKIQTKLRNTNYIELNTIMEK